MGTLTIYFVGICSHLRQDDTDAAQPHRTVLVNAREGLPDRGIEPHFPFMHVRPEDIISGEVPDLTGVTITIHDRNPKANYSPAYQTCIPHLMSFTEELVEINPDVTLGRDAVRAAAYVDIQGGLWQAGVDKGGAAVAYVTIQTDTENVALSIKTFDDEPFPDLVLENNTTIQLENVGSGTDDNDHDFLLHFLIMSRIPGDAWWPEEGDLTCQPLPNSLPWPTRGTVGPGCSNSNYP
jgi:hypothetical protein